MADVIKKIGATNTPTTMDYSSIQAWEDALPANLVTDGNRQIGECYKQGDLAAFIIGGETTDATNYIWLRTATGASFRDNANVRTNALAYNASNGIAVTGSNNYGRLCSSAPDYTVVSYLQMRNTGNGPVLAMEGANSVVDSCILSSGGNDLHGNTIAKNCLLISTLTSSAGVNIGNVYNCTFVNSSAGASGAALRGNNYAPSRNHHNCAVFGYATFKSGADGGTSDYAATDLTTGTEGAHTVTGLTYASQFVSSTSDWRAVSTGGLKAGTPDSTNAPVDITGLTRDTTTPYIGCWEVSGGAAARLSRLTLAGAG